MDHAKLPTANLHTYVPSRAVTKAIQPGNTKTSPRTRLDIQGPGHFGPPGSPASASPTEASSPWSDAESSHTASDSSDSGTPQPPAGLPTRPKEPSQGQGSALPSRFFLDIFAGVHAPLSQAAAQKGLDRYEPFDIVSNAAHDILLDATFESLLRLSWSGAIGLIVCAPPCKEYSRLKMRPGGLQPCGLPHI